MEFVAQPPATTPSPAAPAFLPAMGRILCCLCGTSIVPNDAAMCIPCLHQQHDISSQIETNLEIFQCKKCTRWQVGSLESSHWAQHEMESNGLLTACLKRIPELQGSKDYKILDVTWIWTEPHSKRLKFYVDIEKMLSLNTHFSIQQKVVFEVIIRGKQCIDCIHEATEHNFQSVLQIRQYSFVSSYGTNSNSSHSSSGHNTHNHKKLLYTIEAFCTKYKLFDYMTNLEIVKENGYNFYFKNKKYSEKVINLLTSHFPIHYNHNKVSKKLVSRNLHENTARYEYTYLLELLPYNRDDLVLLPPQYSGQYELMLITKTTSMLHCLQPMSLYSTEISTLKYTVHPCILLATARHMIPFIVLDIQPCQYNPMLPTSAQSSTLMTPQQRGKVNKRDKKKNSKVNGNGNGGNGTGGAGDTGDGFTNASMLSIQSTVKGEGGLLADVVVAKESDLGENDISYTLRTHLGHVLQAGDTVLGYDLQHMVFGLEQETKLSALSYALPDIILVKKVYPDMERKNRTGGNKKKNRIPPWRRNTQPAGAAAEGTVDGTVDDTAVSIIDEEEEAEEEGDEGEDGEDGLVYEEDGLEEIEVLEEELLMEEEEEGEWEDVAAEDADDAQEEEQGEGEAEEGGEVVGKEKTKKVTIVEEKVKKNKK